MSSPDEATPLLQLAPAGGKGEFLSRRAPSRRVAPLSLTPVMHTVNIYR